MPIEAGYPNKVRTLAYKHRTCLEIWELRNTYMHMQIRMREERGERE